MKRSRSGFTLVEVLVVLVILVLLIGLVGPRVLGSQQKANIKKVKLDLGNLGSSLEMYAVENQTFPTTEEGLVALLEKPSDENRAANWDGPYLDAEDLPADPWGNSYRYAYPPKNGKRDFPNIWSPGKDGQDNTDDDIVNWKKTDGGSGDKESSNDNSGDSTS
ncbi:MAG: type II secretion system major pseudopilin GspG [Planctomycetota bacterium]